MSSNRRVTDEDIRSGFASIHQAMATGFDRVAATLTQMENKHARFEQEMLRRFDAVDQRFEAIDSRFDAMDRRFDAMDKRFDDLDVRLDGHDVRLGRLEEMFGEFSRRT
jgi:hypothetical protein